MQSNKFSINSDVAHRLKNYVYALVDPRDGIPFYIGKGTSNRVEHHGLEAKAWLHSERPEGLNEKLSRISDIEKSGSEVDIWILRYGMTQAEYSAVESTLIDFVSTFPIAASSARTRPLHGGTPLTNKVRGRNANEGITRLSDIISELRAPALTTSEPLLLITLGAWKDERVVMPNGEMRLGHGFKNEWMDRKLLDSNLVDLGNSVCCWWNWDINKIERFEIAHLVGIYRGVTRGLFQIKPGSLSASPKYSARRKGCDVVPVTDESSKLWQNVIGLHGHSLPEKKRGERGPFRYWPYGT